KENKKLIITTNMVKTKIIFSGLSVLVLVATFLAIRPALAQMASSTDATSSDVIAGAIDTASIASSTDTVTVGNSASTTPVPITTDASSSSGMDNTTPNGDTSTSSAPVPVALQGLTLVHIIGTKYVDYFTDGTNVTSYPGDPDLDASLNKQDAPI